MSRGQSLYSLHFFWIFAVCPILDIGRMAVRMQPRMCGSNLAAPLDTSAWVLLFLFGPLLSGTEWAGILR